MKDYFKFHWENSKVLLGAMVFAFAFIFLFWPYLIFRVIFTLGFIALLIYSIKFYKKRKKENGKV